MSTETNPFSAAPDLNVDARSVPNDDARDVLNPVECSCGTIHQSARSALECNHEHNHE